MPFPRKASRRAVLAVTAGVVLLSGGALGFSLATNDGAPGPDDALNPLKQVDCSSGSNDGKVVVSHNDYGAGDAPNTYEQGRQSAVVSIFQNDVVPTGFEVRDGARTAEHGQLTVIDPKGQRVAHVTMSNLPGLGWVVDEISSCPDFFDRSGLPAPLDEPRHLVR